MRTGKIRVFKGAELTADHVMASATLPTLFQTIVIDGEPYWDGGYMGNPALFPFFYASSTPDIIIIQVNPLERDTIPHSARDIQNRLDEISFNGALMGELRAIDFVVRLIDAGKLPLGEYTRPLVIASMVAICCGPSALQTKSDASWQLINSFFEFGRTCGKQWLDETYDRVGKEGTLDLRMAYS